jgi:IS4 transposase
MRIQGGDEMVLSEVFDRFAKESPVCVMVRATLENVFSAQRLDDLFTRTAVRQRSSELLFSTIADLMGLVVCRVRPSMHAAFQSRDIGVTIKAVYDKLKGVEPAVARVMVQDTAQRMARIIRGMEGGLPELLPGYRAKILDGNHLPRTQRRLKELRTRNVAPLPGHSLVVLDPALMLAIDVFPCEDGHAQERSLLPGVLETVAANDVWIADRNFCTTGFLCGISDRGAFFLIRQHKGTLNYELLGREKKVGKTDTGVVYEQAMRLDRPGGVPLILRRITIRLDNPTRNGDDEIHVLTNLPAEIDATVLAEAYRRRWTVEGAFQEMEAHLHGEVETLGYPQAALFAFCLALVSYNILSVTKAALRAAQGAEKVEQEVSGYYLADEVAGTWRGMMIILPGEYWTERFGPYTPTEMARFLVAQARQIRLTAFRKHPRGPKKKPPKLNKKQRVHVSTQQMLNERKA